MVFENGCLRRRRIGSYHGIGLIGCYAEVWKTEYVLRQGGRELRQRSREAGVGRFCSPR
jgi:hypothetical protein